jgi:catechol 2,3-dioxygenase-like lactoylglutathione lyase family enzyme
MASQVSSVTAGDVSVNQGMLALEKFRAHSERPNPGSVAMADPRPIFNQLNIVSGDVEASIAFYRRLGVAIPDDSVWRTSTGPHHVSAERTTLPGDAVLDIDSVPFARVWNAGWRRESAVAGRVVVGFGVGERTEVDRLYAEMTSAGYRGLQGPYDAFWGARDAVIEDPDGLAVGLMSEISVQRKSAPPEV